MLYNKAVKKVVQKICAAGVILHGGKVLIIQRSSDDEAFPGLWELPSGKQESLETTIDAVKREVKEETGLNVEVDRIVGSFKFKVEKEDEIRDVTQISFLVKPVDSVEVKLSSEHQNFAWITKDEIDNYNLSEETKGVIRKAFRA